MRVDGGSIGERKTQRKELHEHSLWEQRGWADPWPLSIQPYCFPHAWRTRISRQMPCTPKHCLILVSDFRFWVFQFQRHQILLASISRRLPPSKRCSPNQITRRLNIAFYLCQCNKCKIFNSSAWVTERESKTHNLFTIWGRRNACGK